MDQGMTNQRVKRSIIKLWPFAIILTVLFAAILGGLNVKKQSNLIEADKAAIEKKEEEESNNAETSEEGALTPREKRALVDANWSDLQVKYYDYRTSGLIDMNQQNIEFLQNSLLNKGNLYDMPFYQVLSQYHFASRMPDGENTIVPADGSRTINLLYQCQPFYDEARAYLNDPDLSEVYIDELISVRDDPITSTVTVKAYHPDSKIAEQLALSVNKYMALNITKLGSASLKEIDRFGSHENMVGIINSRKSDLRDMRTFQDELVILQSQEPPERQQKNADQKEAPTVRGFSKRSLILNVVIGGVLGLGLYFVLAVAHALYNRNRFLPGDYAEEGVGILVSWPGNKAKKSQVWQVKDENALALFLSKSLKAQAEQVLLMQPEKEKYFDHSAFSDFHKASYSLDGKLAIPDIPEGVSYVVVGSPKAGMTRTVFDSLKTSLHLLDYSINAVVLR